ncbi:MAG: mandelate racemase/muconate lactonizing enzyme family protein [Solirubrobacterales bacterium]
MKIAEVETVPYALPFREDYVTARGALAAREMVLLRLRTDEGVEGLGEAVPMTLRGGDSLERVERALQRSTRRIRRLDPSLLAGEEPLEAAIDAFIEVAAGRRLPGPAAAALEMAILDLAGKLSGQPLWKLLRGERAEPVRCNATLAAGPPAQVAAAAARWAERGFSAFKLKIGTGDDVRQVREVRDAVGAAATIRVDANGAYPPREAIALLRDLEPVGVELAEQPSPTLRDLAAVSAASPIAVAADESVSSAKDADRARDSGACRYATAKLSKVGGIGVAGAIASRLPTYLSSALDGPVGIAAAGHAALAIYRTAEDPGLAHGLATQELFAATIAMRACEVRDGCLHVPEGPGLGVELDPKALEHHRLP